MPYSSDENSDYSDDETHSPTTVNNLSESEENTEVKTSKSTKVDYLKLFEEHSILMDKLGELYTNFMEKEKDFEKVRKEYYSERKRLTKECEAHYKKMSKKVVSKLSKGKKGSKSSATKSGGFTKPQPVPKKLKKFLEIDEDELPRPEVSKRLHAKFKDLGFKDGADKKVTVISDKKVAKQLGVEHNFEITFATFQTFLAKFYNDEKKKAEKAAAAASN